MKYLVALLFAALSLNAVGQTNPNYNPDYDDDGVIGVSDILGILSTFGENSSPYRPNKPNRSGEAISPLTSSSGLYG